jgi:hypothetical protein
LALRKLSEFLASGLVLHGVVIRYFELAFAMGGCADCARVSRCGAKMGDLAVEGMPRSGDRGITRVERNHEILDWTTLPPAVDGVPVRVPIHAEWVFDEIIPRVHIEFQGDYAESGVRLGGVAKYTIGVPKPSSVVMAAAGAILVGMTMRRRARKKGKQ